MSPEQPWDRLTWFLNEALPVAEASSVRMAAHPDVRGTVPNDEEVFVDEGDVDMMRALRILEKNGFEGLLIPDHTPRMSCEAPRGTQVWPLPSDIC